MNMVGRATNAHYLASCGVDQLPNVTMHSFKVFLFDFRTCSLNVKYEV